MHLAESTKNSFCDFQRVKKVNLPTREAFLVSKHIVKSIVLSKSCWNCNQPTRKLLQFVILHGVVLFEAIYNMQMRLSCTSLAKENRGFSVSHFAAD